MKARPHDTQYWLTRIVFQRALAFIYFIGFLIIVQQYVPLLGANGVLPARLFISKVSFWQNPSIFFLNSSDRTLIFFGWIGLGLSLFALSGFSERFGSSCSACVWSLLWLIYLSFVNVGQTFYGFGWEFILLETGFLAIFFGSINQSPPRIVVWLIRWILFRVMFGAGLIKMRGDSCWLDLTCMMYHYETQPIPNPLSWYFHHLPVWYHKLEVIFTHLVELIVPFGYLIPCKRIIYTSGIVTVVFQVALIVSGNLSWLNYMTLILAIPCFDDTFFLNFMRIEIPKLNPISFAQKVTIGILLGVVLLLSVNPVRNMISPGQVMNASFNPLHLVNTYGAFGRITKKRMEVILEGTRDHEITSESLWHSYEFKCKPGDPNRRPCVVSPYHLRLDWQMWFAAMSPYQYHPWILNLISKLLQNDELALRLLDHNPFADKRPTFIRVSLYEYRFTSPKERKKSNSWWVREHKASYLPSLSLEQIAFKKFLNHQGWFHD
jgi:hypothetical protein